MIIARWREWLAINEPFGPDAADPEIAISGKIAISGFFIKIYIFDMFPVFFGPGAAGGIQKIKKKKKIYFGQKIDMCMLEVIRLYSIIGTRQSNCLTI